MIVALVPAHNEEGALAGALATVMPQVGRTVVVADNCIDRTVEIARASGAEVLTTEGNVDRKAGALNQALARLLPALGDDDLLLVVDADSRLCRGWVRQARHRLSPGVGAVCAAFHADERAGLLAALQRNEFHRFARSNARRRARAVVLSGVATIVPVRVLRHVARERGGALPGLAGEVYERTASTEDIELTVVLLRLGYRLLTPRACRATTDTMSSVSALHRQRLRWQRGMVDTLQLHGANAVTARYALRQVGIYALSLALPLTAVLWTVVWMLDISYTVHAWWMLPPLLISVERALTAHPRHRVLAALVVPELVYDISRSIWYWQALGQSVRRMEREWIAT